MAIKAKKFNKTGQKFKLVSNYKPAGDQPKAIKQLIDGLNKKQKLQTLLGVTGSGKTYTVANVIQAHQKPTLVMAHNKTLAFQLYTELKEFFPENKVEFFISYYDYYQPESYIPSTDTYIAKDAQINPRIEQMRLSATTSLMTRNDVIIVASVSCIYGLGNPNTFENLSVDIFKGQKITRRDFMIKLLEMQYKRNDKVLDQGNFRVKGNIIDIVPAYDSKTVYRIQLTGDSISAITEYALPEFEVRQTHNSLYIFPAKHFVVENDEKEKVLNEIRTELKDYLPVIRTQNEFFAERLKQRVEYDIEMIEEMGYCTGVENYSRFFDGRKKDERPYCLLDYFPDDFLLIMDESHQSFPQVGAMFKGDRSRKEKLVEYGFRLPSALDNRPLKIDEFKQFMNKVIFVSATPADYEKEHSSQIVEQIIRPTGLVDPLVEIRPIEGQIKDLLGEIKSTVKQNNRVLITTLTKKLAEELTNYLAEHGVKVRYLHSEIDSLERTKIIKSLRLGKFDVLVGINLLREGLDIPEVGFVGILDADKEGFLRNDKSLIQTIGRAARNIEAKVVLYADVMTDSIKRTIAETNRRRTIQLEYNKVHNITPKTIIKPISDEDVDVVEDIKSLPKKDIPSMIIVLESKMKEAADNLDFEEAIKLRNKANELRAKL